MIRDQLLWFQERAYLLAGVVVELCAYCKERVVSKPQNNLTTSNRFDTHDCVSHIPLCWRVSDQHSAMISSIQVKKVTIGRSASLHEMLGRGKAHEPATWVVIMRPLGSG
jgi:hypothetical protein